MCCSSLIFELAWFYLVSRSENKSHGRLSGCGWYANKTVGFWIEWSIILRSCCCISELLTKKKKKRQYWTWREVSGLGRGCRVVKCLRNRLLGTSGVREARHQEMPKINGYLIPHVTHTCTFSLGKKADWSLSEQSKSKLGSSGLIVASLVMVETLPSCMRSILEEFSRYCELSHQMTALSSVFMDLYK